ncbi:hypothetical protein [Chitinophaga sancti]|uniref:Uncharacterized protein n=1 Tax=Chitinophaga sancti TaxID=1004 RepID=A0A1K1QC29_9BACT|nr:hypothetical protein [Chitinophaga sancti]WQD61365.1 hypothetical protein U0033_26165 [Chitinophaga sancti]WQG93082.1 hypothetical protein SR876_16295 [Chitinophaga sancti]SFW57471.1 hypothetical protein SAMN05661012_02684 [Chitinophaga sancti]
MKTLFLYITLLLLLASCDKEDVILQEIVPVNDTLRGVYSSNTLLTSDRLWYVEGWVYIINKSSLRIEPGTHIKVLADPAARSGGGIIIVRDSKLVAKGTAGFPIKFQFTDTMHTHWNGLILMGNAPQRKDFLSPEGKELSYGGDVAEDSSGIIQHVDMNFHHLISPGILLLGVGSKTRIDHVMTHTQVSINTEGYNDL